MPPVSFIIIAQSLIGETETQISLQRKNEYEQLIDADPTLICYYNFRLFDSGRNTRVARNSEDTPHSGLSACHVSSESRATRVFYPLPSLFADIGHCSQAMLNVNFVFRV